MSALAPAFRFDAAAQEARYIDCNENRASCHGKKLHDCPLLVRQAPLDCPTQQPNRNYFRCWKPAVYALPILS